MKTLTSLPLFDLLEKAARKHVFTDIALDAAYDDFVSALASLCDTETSFPHLMRVLCYTRLELTALQKQILHTTGGGAAEKKCGRSMPQSHL